MNKYAKRIIGIISICIIISVVMYALQLLVLNDGEDISLRVQSFYLEEKNSLDVVIMGASEVRNGYCAPEVYRAYGYTSYPYAFVHNPVELWKYELAEIEKNQQPQMLIVELNGSLYVEDKFIHSKDGRLYYGNALPLSANGIRYAYEIAAHPMESLFPFIKYHYKWKSFRKPYVRDRMMIYRNGYARLRGAMTPLYFTEIDTSKVYPADDKTADLNPECEEELREFLELCKASEIPHIVFVEFPHILTTEEEYARHQRSNRAAEIVRSEGFDCVDLTREMEAIGLDYHTDFFDKHHLIATGQRKLSDYLGKMIRDKYHISPRTQTEANVATWKDSAELIDKYYKCYEENISRNADKRFEEKDYDLSDTVRTMHELDAVMP